MTEESWVWVGLVAWPQARWVAASAYFAMAGGQGGREMSDGHVFFYVRYLDWSITTPLLLLGLCITALNGAHRRPTLVAAELGADLLMRTG